MIHAAEAPAADGFLEPPLGGPGPMADTPSEMPPDPVPSGNRANVFGVLSAALAALTLALLAFLVIARQPHDLLWLVRVLLCCGAVLVLQHIVRREFRNVLDPVTHLAELIRQVRRGEQPMESLSGVRELVRPVAAEVQSLMRELRQQKQANAQLQAEIPQRVANRTDALQRTIAALRRQATKDGLTGLYNRRMLDGVMPELIDQHISERLPLSVLAIDVDNFKQLNDTLGHPAGDQFLQTLAQVLQSSIRADDFAFRCGGDEFAVVLTACELDAAERLAWRLQRLVAQFSATFKSTPPPSISVGVAALGQAPNFSAEALLGLADRRLYEAKQARKTS